MLRKLYQKMPRLITLDTKPVKSAKRVPTFIKVSSNQTTLSGTIIKENINQMPANYQQDALARHLCSSL